jgi:nucleoside-diphosphate-sugar epimerase
MRTLPIVVTGAKGYVGQRLVSELEKRRFKVFEVDLLGPQGFDLSEPHAVDKLGAFLPKAYDLIHLAFPFPGTMASGEMTSLVQRINHTLISLDPGPSRTLFVSSTAVYSPDRSMEYAPWEVYGRLKGKSETELSRLGSLTVLRPGTLIDSARRSAMASLYFRAVTGKTALLPKSGTLAHPFLHVDDLVHACVSWSQKNEPDGFTRDLWAAEPISAFDYLKSRGLKSRILSLPEFVQRTVGFDRVPLLGISKWHLTALNYDVRGKESGGSDKMPLRKMSEIFDDLLSRPS